MLQYDVPMIRVDLPKISFEKKEAPSSGFEKVRRICLFFQYETKITVPVLYIHFFMQIECFMRLRYIHLPEKN